MNIATALVHTGTGRFFGLVTDALRGITRRQCLGAVLFGLGLYAFIALIHWDMVVLFAKGVPIFVVVSKGVLDHQIYAFCLLVALVIADRAVDEGANKRAAYVAAALGGCILAVLIDTTVFDWAWRTFVWSDDSPPRTPWLAAKTIYYVPIYVLTSNLPIFAGAVFLYADRRAARKTEAHLHVAELDRIRRSKLALESRLQAMQARVEPQFLFNTLAQVERLYELDPALAGRMLDDLIAYLRAAMPKMRDTSSTVAQEIELVRAYLAIVRIRLGNRLEVSIDAPAELADVRLPPMMLLPLVDHAVVHGLEPARHDGSIRIVVSLDGERLRLTIADTGAGFVTDADGVGIDSIRERLSALYGEKADLTLRSSPGGGTEALMEIPYEPAAAA